jgi:serine/threonine protein kinase
VCFLLLKSLGHVLYVLLTGHFPWEDADTDDSSHVQEMVQKGSRPNIDIDVDYTHSKNPQVRALVRAMSWCWELDPRDRPTAQQVEDLLGGHLPDGLQPLPRRR